MSNHNALHQKTMYINCKTEGKKNLKNKPRPAGSKRDDKATGVTSPHQEKDEAALTPPVGVCLHNDFGGKLAVHNTAEYGYPDLGFRREHAHNSHIFQTPVRPIKINLWVLTSSLKKTNQPRMLFN